MFRNLIWVYFGLPSKIGCPIFFANFGQPVSKYWLRPCFPIWEKCTCVVFPLSLFGLNMAEKGKSKTCMYIYGKTADRWVIQISFHILGELELCLLKRKEFTELLGLNTHLVQFQMHVWFWKFCLKKRYLWTWLMQITSHCHLNQVMQMRLIQANVQILLMHHYSIKPSHFLPNECSNLSLKSQHCVKGSS